MINYGFSRVLIGIGYSILFGILLCLLSVSVSLSFSLFGSLISIPQNVVKHSKSKAAASQYLKSKTRDFNVKSKALSFVNDLVFCIFFAILLSLLFYVAEDGEKRVYLLITMTLFYILCKKIIGNRLAGAIHRLLSVAVKTFTLALVFLLLPLRSIVSRLILSTKRAVRNLAKRKSMHHLKRKEAEADN